MVKYLQNRLIMALILLCPIQLAAQYCTTSYGSAQCNSYNMYIQDFITTGGVTNISNLSSACGNSSTSYIYYSNLKHAGIQGTTVNLSIKIGSSYQQGVKVWVDFNADGDFTDAGENVFSPSSVTPQGGTATGSFTIPANAPPGLTRMRVRSSYSTTSFTECGAQSYGECEDYVFEIVPSCSAKFTTDPSNVKACDKTSALFTAAASSTDSFFWQANYGSGWITLGDDLNHSGTTTDSMTVKNLAMSMYGFQYRAVAVNKAGNCTVNSKPAILEMTPASEASIVIAPNPGSEICEKTEVTMYATWSNGGTTPKYQWVINGQDVPGEVNGTLKTKDLANGDIIECRFMSSAICVPAKLSNPVPFTVNPQLVPKVSLAITHDGGSTYTYTAIPTNGGPDPKYIWYRNNSLISGAKTDSYTFTDLKSYDKVVVKMVSSAPCVDSASTVVSSDIVVTGINSANTALYNLLLHPNPNNGSFNISGAINTTTDRDIVVTITNIMGQAVAHYNYQTDKSLINIPVNVQHLPGGLYNANISIGDEQINIRFTISQ